MWPRTDQTTPLPRPSWSPDLDLVWIATTEGAAETYTRSAASSSTIAASTGSCMLSKPPDTTAATPRSSCDRDAELIPASGAQPAVDFHASTARPRWCSVKFAAGYDVLRRGNCIANPAHPLLSASPSCWAAAVLRREREHAATLMHSGPLCDHCWLQPVYWWPNALSRQAPLLRCRLQKFGKFAGDAWYANRADDGCILPA